MTEQAALVAVDHACRELRLPTIRAQFPDLVDSAANDQMSYRVVLADLLLAKCSDCARTRSERPIKAAQFPREKSLGAFAFDANNTVAPAAVHYIATCWWVKKGLPLRLIGRIGHRQISLAHRRVRQPAGLTVCTSRLPAQPDH